MDIVNIDDAEPTYLEGDGGHLVGLASGVEPRIRQWLEVLTAKAYERATYKDMAQTYDIDPLRKYIRIVMANADGIGSRSVHAFVDPVTGDVYKSAGWAKPAKHVRYNLLDDASFTTMLEGCDAYGSYLYIR